jgi:hypothetical protein
MISRKMIAVGMLLLFSLPLSACMATTSSQPATQHASSVSGSSKGAGMDGTDVDSRQDRHTDDTENHNLAILRFVRGF